MVIMIAQLVYVGALALTVLCLLASCVSSPPTRPDPALEAEVRYRVAQLHQSEAASRDVLAASERSFPFSPGGRGQGQPQGNVASVLRSAR